MICIDFDGLVEQCSANICQPAKEVQGNKLFSHCRIVLKKMDIMVGDFHATISGSMMVVPDG
jgi:hypothetical protein